MLSANIEVALRKQLFSNPWWVVAASFCALLFGAGSFTFVFGVFVRPVSEGLGISRGVISTGLLLFAVMAACACPFIGGAVDRWGTRRVLLPLILCFALSTAALSMLRPNNLMIWTLFSLCGLSAVGLTPVPFVRAISTHFDRHRGVALGITIAGVGCGLAILPPLIGLVIIAFGWRSALIGYGIGVFVVAFLPVALFIEDRPSGSHTGSAVPQAPASVLAGLSASDASRSWRFWVMLAAFFLGVVSVNGTLSHTVSFLTDRGYPTGQAVAVLSSVGIMAICSRVACGWLLDRYPGPRLASLLFFLPMVGIRLISSDLGGAWPFVGAALVGIVVGGEVDMLAYFVGGYFGLRAMGKIYGCMFAVFAVGSGVGPFLSGAAFDRFHSYRQIFGLYQVLLFVACVLVSRLGPYSYPGRHDRKVNPYPEK